MIDKIKFQNYKAFDKGEIEIRPLTLLLGANSSGKSSILHLFLMLEQTINNADKYNSALKTNGHSVSLGEDENLLKDRKHDKQMHLEFEFEAAEYIKSIKALQEERLEKLSTLLLFLSKNAEELKEYNNFIRKFIKTEKIGKHSSLYNYLKSSLIFHLNRNEEESNESINYETFNLLKDFSLAKLTNELLFNKTSDIIESKDKRELLSIISSLSSCFNAFNNAFNNKRDSASIKYVLTFNNVSRKLKVTECHVTVGGKAVILIQNKGKESFISSQIFVKEDLEKLTQLTKLHFEFDCLSIQSISKQNSLFTEYITLLVGEAFKFVKNSFSEKNINYVGPLRANPQRYYFLDDSNTNTTLVHRSGASLAEILKKNKSVRDKINKWLERFEFNVDVREFKDIIHNIKVTQNNLLLDIPDVGFGISQVLPILVVGMMAPQSSTIIMEQPEIHLHPKMQAELADLFIDILQLQSSKKSQINRHLIIETHSEYIIKRIRRRMAEGLISPKDVAIYFVNPRNKEHPDTAEIQLAPISEDGTIEWPEEFYMTELEDEMAFFRAKMRKS